MFEKEKRSLAFTLIELLIVVAIIAILAAIAVPNFLGAQTRAKYTRAISDLRTISTALEAYAVDHNKYPLNRKDLFYSVPDAISTPIAYITQGRLIDPFGADRLGDPSSEEYTSEDPTHIRLYTYHTIMDGDTANKFTGTDFSPPAEAVDAGGFNPGAFERYGHWKLLSYGPDGLERNTDIPFGADILAFKSFDIPYDPTNGAISSGNIFRTHRSTVGEGTLETE